MIATLRKLMAMVSKPGRYYTGLAVIGLVSAAVNILMAYVLMLFIQSAQAGSAQLLYDSLSLMMVAVTSIMILSPLGFWLLESTVVDSTASLRSRVFRRVLHLTAAWLETKHSGDMTSRTTTDIQAAEQAYSTNIVNLVETGFAGVGSAAAMLLVDWKLGTALIVLGALGVWINRMLVRPMEKVAYQVQQALGTVTERISDIANGYQVIRMFNSSRAQHEKFRVENVRAVHLGLTRVKYAANVNGFNMINGYVSFLGIAVAGGWLVMQGWYDLGTIMLFVQLQNSVRNLFASLGTFINQVQTSLAGGRRVLELLDAPQEPLRIALPAAPAGTAAAIALENVTFAYPDSAEAALKDISLEFRAGETAALVGPSGGGKSTLFKLLLGCYPPESGAITILGSGLDQYTLSELRERIAFVPQTSYLFSGTIAENIGLGKPAASLEEIQTAAKAAYAHEFICQLPDGYQTLVGERGSHLSGGQRQRIAIARAILRNAPLLLLDEATSSLDNDSEGQVQMALNELMQGRTTLVIAHRLSTVRNADRIVVIDRGQVAEEGTHRDLVEAGGIYQHLYTMQFEEDLQNAG